MSELDETPDEPTRPRPLEIPFESDEHLLDGFQQALLRDLVLELVDEGVHEEMVFDWGHRTRVHIICPAPEIGKILGKDGHVVKALEVLFKSIMKGVYLQIVVRAPAQVS